MKKATTFVVTIVVLYTTAAAYGLTTFDAAGARTPTIAQASKDVSCPACGTKNPAGAVYCTNCGKKLPESVTGYNYCPECGEKTTPGEVHCANCGCRLYEPAETRHGERRWERNLLTLSGGVGAWFGNKTCWAPTVDIVFNVSDYFVFGPDFSYFFHGHDSGYLAGAEFRPYVIPYSRSYFLKPHASVGVGFGREKIDAGWRDYIVRRWYVRPGGGLDVRVAESRFAPYFNWGVLILIRGAFKDPYQLDDDQITGTAFTFEGGVRITL